ncbi:MAG TPA: DUF169 domain-containing protein [Syntrophorhabdales bacterium]|nr:DUF169 domain-containing protein [Syntrophorhabdales bacterium]
MDMDLKENFVRLWKRHFKSAELPLVFYYADDEKQAEAAKAPKEHRCIIADLQRVRHGTSLKFDVDTIGCAGGKRYLGFSESMRPDFEYFLSYGIPGKLEGERYKKSPEMVTRLMKTLPVITAPSRFIVFKRWDKLQAADEPVVAIFLASPDVLSGLFTLANYDRDDVNGAIAPFGAGCSTIVQYPYMERNVAQPKAIIGMLDVSARPCVHANAISFALPMVRLQQMIANMEESFLITSSWRKVSRRIV